LRPTGRNGIRFDITVVRQVIKLHVRAAAQDVDYSERATTGTELQQPDGSATH
jgi:hypothetical protein